MWSRFFSQGRQTVGPRPATHKRILEQGFKPQLEILEQRLNPDVTAASLDHGTFDYQITQVPDLDQRRTAAPGISGLPGDGGMYCVPTSAVNLMGYIANHGYPNVSPGVANLQTADYNWVTSVIDSMGQLMGTDPDKGTGDSVPVLRTWLEAGAPGSFVVSGYGSNSPSDPLFFDMALSAIEGDLVNPSFGWYTNFNTKYKDQPEQLAFMQSFGVDTAGFFRAGGHVFSMVHAHGFSSEGVTQGQIGIHDPAAPNDGQTTTQSTFHDDLYTVDQVTAPLLNSDQTGSTTWSFSRLPGYGGTPWLDGYVAIRPLFGLTSDQATLRFNLPIHLFGAESPSHVDFRSATGGDVLDIAIHPRLTRHPYLIAGDNHVWQIDKLTGESTVLATVADPQRLVMGGRQSNLFVLSTRELIRMSETGEIQKRTPLLSPLDAIAYDERHDRLIGVSLARGELWTFDRDLQPLAVSSLRPVGAEPGAGSTSLTSDDRAGFESGPLSLSVTGDDHGIVIWMHQGGSAMLTRVALGDDGAETIGQVRLDSVDAPQGLAVDDFGRLYVSDHGLIKVFDSNGRPVDSPFNGMPGGAHFQILRGFDDFDPARATNPAYDNVLPQNVDAERPRMVVQGGTLVLVGTSRDDRIDIDDRGRMGVFVNINGLGGSFPSDIRRIIALGLDGNDSIMHGYTGESDFKPRDVVVNGGNGGDTFHSELTHSLGLQAPTWSVQVFGANGDDVADVSLRSSASAPLTLMTPIHFFFDGGNGKDAFRLALDNVLIAASIAVEAFGGDGVDSFMEGQSVTVAENRRLQALLSGDNGEDEIFSRLYFTPANRGRARVTELGGDGGDLLTLELYGIGLDLVEAMILGGRGKNRIHATPGVQIVTE